jgi:hypothetical protein
MEYVAATLRMESRVRRASFLCPKACPAGDFFAHAERVIAALQERIDCKYYGVPEMPIETGVPHLDTDADRIWQTLKTEAELACACPQERPQKI